MRQARFKRNRGVYKCHTFGTLQYESMFVESMFESPEGLGFTLPLGQDGLQRNIETYISSIINCPGKIA